VVQLDRNGLEVLDTAECLRLLHSTSVGRVGITSGGLPAILPVNYQLVGHHILFRTGKGTKLDAATQNAVVAFEVDGSDPLEHTGWSVLAVGVARDLTDVLTEIPFDTTSVPRWAAGADGRVVVIAAEMLSGRRLTHDAPEGSPEG
jgi:hypothetical protein